MKTIPSFTIDHIRLLRGIYVSQKMTKWAVKRSQPLTSA